MTFYLRMAWRSLRRSRGLTVVMVVALSLGIGTWYAEHQVLGFLDGKVPDAPRDVYQVAVERGGTAATPGDIISFMPSVLLAPRDAQGVLDGSGARRQTMTFGAMGLVERDGKPATAVRVRYATRDLFEMFSVPFVAGGPWAASEDVGMLAGTPGDEAVIDEVVARRLFGDVNVVGRSVRVDGAEVRIVGVVAARFQDTYQLYERFVNVRTGIYVPLANAAAAHAHADFEYAVAGAEPGGVGVWVELPTEAARSSFRAHADAYLARERASGVTLRPARDWQATYRPGGTVDAWPAIAVMCIVTSLINVVRMLMAKFADRRHDLGLFRAFGARRSAILGQLLLEAMLIGLMAGIGGLVLGLALMPLAASTIATTPGSVATISAGAVASTLGLALGLALVASLYPAWRLSRGCPAVQLRRC